MTKVKENFFCILYIFFISILSHLLFSSLGFTPTDDGFILAGSRRIIERQIPHKDFITVRPPGSFYIHTLDIILGGEFVFLFSRFLVLLQFACISWIWTIIITEVYKKFLSLFEKILLSTISFIFCVHFFPLMPWHSIDGLFFISVGIIFSKSPQMIKKIIGYFFIGSASLCKQNFLILIPVTLIINDDYKKILYWLVSISPILFYFFFLLFSGSFNDAIIQLLTHTEFFNAGIKNYIKNYYFPWGILFGVFISYLNNEKVLLKKNIYCIINIIVNIILYIFFIFALRLPSHFPNISFFVLGIVIGKTFFLLKENDLEINSKLKVNLLTIFTAWCISISLGWNNPSLMSGPLMLVIMASQINSKYFFKKYSQNAILKLLYNFQYKYKIILELYLIILICVFKHIRENYIYYEEPKPQLTERLDGIFPGGNGIKTNITTFQVLKDLNIAKKYVIKNGKKYCIVPDLAANWVKDSQINPLPIDWLNITEIANPKLIEKIKNSLDSMNGNIIIIITKYRTFQLSKGLERVSTSHPIINFILTNFQKIFETEYFELYY